jgi:hypothetical protein
MPRTGDPNPSPLLARAPKEPGELARRAEEEPRLPAAGCECVSGYGVTGPLFRSGHGLGLRLPQRGIFALGRVFVTPLADAAPAPVPAAEVR